MGEHDLQKSTADGAGSQTFHTDKIWAVLLGTLWYLLVKPYIWPVLGEHIAVRFKMWWSGEQQMVDQLVETAEKSKQGKEALRVGRAEMSMKEWLGVSSEEGVELIRRNRVRLREMYTEAQLKGAEEALKEQMREYL